MALISIKRDVDLQPGLSAPAVFHCSQGDVGTTIMLGLLNGGVDYPITTSTEIQISGSRSTGEVFSSVTATWSGSTVSFNLTAEMTADPGPTLCEAVLTRGTDILGTANFILAVEENPMGNVPPGIFTDAGWLWVLDKLSSEQVAALGDDVIGAINSKADADDVTTALATKVNVAQGAGNAGKVLVINSSGNVVPGDTPIEIDDTLTQTGEAADAKAVGDALALKIDKNQGAANFGKALVVSASGNVVPGTAVAIDPTLTQANAAADAKATGDKLAEKLNIYQGTGYSGKALVVGNNGAITVGDAVAIDSTLTQSGAAADAKAVGDELTDLNEDLMGLNTDFSNIGLSVVDGKLSITYEEVTA